MFKFINRCNLFLKRMYGASIINYESSAECWNPCEELLSKNKQSNYALIVLNTQIEFKSNSTLLNVWNQAKVRVTVDGGTEMWLSWLTRNKYNPSEIIPPELITGDMDSLPNEILNYFKDKSEVIRTPNQDETDFTKALDELIKYCCKRKISIDTIYVLAETCGRFDQIMGNINTLYKASAKRSKVKIYQIASNSVTWVLPKGLSNISIPLVLRQNKEWCSLIPVGSSCIVSTKGLQWNLDKRIVEFGGLVSSSNTYDDSPTVEVETNKPLVWSMGISSLFLQ